ncbi:MAG TPA: neutral zinc metallopeptidase [Gemmatimonadaceae bacterium]|nr:neutral zinc metallopeptidase [Gemmatimonadaceae bacterium]
MRWTPGGRSRNLEDRRGSGMGIKLGGVGVVILLVLSLLTGRNLFEETDTGDVAGGTSGLSAQDSAREEPTVQFVSFVLDDAQQSYARLVNEAGGEYHDADLVLFRGAVQSGCGMAQSAMGPFYCPLDEKVYLDLGFFDELRDRFGAPGDFAEAYVIAHELGHHVQHLLGTDAQVREAQERDPQNANEYSVRLELQADCYAGVWGNTTARRDILEPGDVDEGLGAAASVGDDRIQRQTEGTVHPESFTHGSAAQRAAWLRRGLESGRLEACDTFGGE